MFSIEYLCKYKRYQNPDFLIQLDYSFEEIDNPMFASIALLSTQQKINRITLEQLSLKYVYQIVEEKKSTKELKKIRKKIVRNSNFDGNILVIPNNVLMQKLKTKIKQMGGYKTYGDYESFYSVFFSPIMMYSDFLNFTDDIRIQMENIPERQGLIKYLQFHMKHEYFEFQKLVESYI